MRAEPRTTGAAGSAGPVRGGLHRFASARPEILVVSSPGFAADGEVSSALRSCVVELDMCSHVGARSLARSNRCGIDTAVEGRTASGTFVTGLAEIAAPSSITSPARQPSIGPDHLRPVDPARQPRRPTGRQLALTT